MSEVWGITKREHGENNPLSGEGARRYPGRWHPRGSPVLYTSRTLSLAALEVFVHLPARKHLPSDLVAIQIDVSGVSVRRVGMEELPPDWDRALPIAATEELARGWLETGDACGLDVPSAVIPLERNLILNPGHPDFETLKVLSVHPFRFDSRMLQPRDSVARH